MDISSKNDKRSSKREKQQKQKKSSALKRKTRNDDDYDDVAVLALDDEPTAEKRQRAIPLRKNHLQLFTWRSKSSKRFERLPGS